MSRSSHWKGVGPFCSLSSGWVRSMTSTLMCRQLGPSNHLHRRMLEDSRRACICLEVEMTQGMLHSTLILARLSNVANLPSHKTQELLI